MFIVTLVYPQCNYTLTLNDSGGDGWLDIFGSTNGYIQIDTNGVNIYNLALSSGSTNTYMITVDNASSLVLTYHRACTTEWWCLGNENSWVLTDCNGSTVATGTHSTNLSTTITTNCSSCSAIVDTDGDCGVATTVCNSSSITNNATGIGNRNDLNLTNEGCLASGENYTTWIFFHAQTSGTLGFTIHPNNEDGGANDDYDFAIWQTSTCPPSSTPTRCTWAVGGNQNGYTGCFNRNIGYDTGLGTSMMVDTHDDSEGMCGDGWVNTINATAGDEFALVVDNYTGNNNSFTLTWSLTGGASLDCTPLPVDYTPMTYDCFEGKLTWQTLSEVNNNYFTIETGNSFDVYGNFIPKEIYVVDAVGTSSFISNYTFNINLENTYVRLSQCDYNGKSRILETKYFTCQDNFVSSIQLIPNPASANSIISIDGEYNNVMVFSMLGKKVNVDINNNKIIGLRKGFYLVCFDNKKPVKLVVQ